MGSRHIIDSHQHVFWLGRDDKGLVADMDEQRISSAWLLTWEIAPWEDRPEYYPQLNPLNVRTDGTHGGIPLRDLISARDRYPDRFVLGYCPHPLMGDAPALLRAAADIHGVKVCGEWKFRIPFDDPRCLELYSAAGEMKLPVVLHLDVPHLPDGTPGGCYQPNWYGGTIDNLERALVACPNTIFIGHAPGFWRELGDDAAEDPSQNPSNPSYRPGRLYQLFDRNENLYADLSAGSALLALRRNPQHTADFLQRYRKRLLFGRDRYGGELHSFLQSLGLPQAVQDDLYFGNATRILGDSTSLVA